MSKLAIAILLQIIFSTALNAQTFIAFNAVPCLSLNKDNTSGQTFNGYKIKKLNWAFTTSLSLGRKFTNFSLSLGLNYYLYNTKSEYYSDETKNKLLLNKNSINISYFEPILAIEKNLVEKQYWGLSFSFGLAYQIQSTPYFSLTTTIDLPKSANLGNYMFVKTTIQGTKYNIIERLKYLPKLSYSHNIGKNCLFNAGFLLRISRNEAILTREVNLNNSFYNFKYFLNSSSFGLNLGLVYLIK
jgi:hypothetical protein